ncbi:MAG: hypothetical protein V1701_03630 [Planctomycetota bacterium]
MLPGRYEAQTSPRNNRDGIYPPETIGRTAVPPVVPPENSGLWNYMGSKILRKAVEKGALTQSEAEVVMEYAVYDRSLTYIGKVLGILPEEALNLFEQAMPKLRKWAEHSVLVMPDKHIICD